MIKLKERGVEDYSNQIVATPKKNSQLEVQFDLLDTSFRELDEVVETLESKLTSILTEDFPVLRNDEEKDEALTPLSGRVRSYARRVNQKVKQLNNIRGRIEL